jgi:hypothetical protein
MFETARFSITNVYKYLIPFGTPAPSAFVMGINLHKFMVSAIGTEYGWLAWLVAIIGVLGMEGVGGLSSILVSRSYVSKNYGIMRWAFLAVFGYAACVVVGIWTGGDSRAMVVTVVLTLLGYFVMAMWEGLQGFKEQHVEELDTLHAETELARQQASIARANARAARDGQGGQMPRVSTVHLDKMDTKEAKLVRSCWNDNPNWSARQIASACQVSPTTASKYKPMEQTK